MNQDKTTERERYEQWAESTPKGSEIIPAATVILLRDGSSGLETLMLRRDSKLAFVAGMWVFPGGRVDADDAIGLDDEIEVGRHTASREAMEEAGLRVEPGDMAPWSHWMPPALTPRRFSTWFYVAQAPDGHVRVDGGEITTHAWMGVSEAMDRRNADEIELAPPTFITLTQLSAHDDTASVLAAASASTPEYFETRIAKHGDDIVALYDGDSGYADTDPDAAGRRHRLVMTARNWRYLRD